MRDILNSLKNSSKKIPVKKGYYFLLPLFLVAPNFAHANFFEDGLINIIIKFGFFFIGAIISIILYIVNSIIYTFAWLARYILEMAINLSLSVQYTSGDVFNAGWPVMRDLANMGLILILVGIGVGTMLNLKLNKDRLAMFFVVALLINFTNVITGVIIDFSNIVGSVFFNAAKNSLSAIMGTSPLDLVLSSGKGLLLTQLSAFLGEEELAGTFFGLISGPLIASMMGLVLLFVFMLMTALFIARILALLLLVILSPVAFLGLIFASGTSMRRLWNKWWDNFLSWSIIVIPMLFFLWLAGIFLNDGSAYFNSCMNLVPSGAGAIQDSVGAGSLDFLLCSSIRSLLAIGALLTGIVVSFKSSAAGSKMVINQAKSVQKWSKKKAREGAGRYARRASANVAGQAGTQIAGSRAAGMRGIGAPLRTLGRRLQNVEVQQRTEWRKYSKNYAGMTLDQKLAHTKSEKDPDKIIALWDTIRREQLDQVDAIRANPSDNRITDKDINRYLQHAHYRTDEKGEDISKEWLRANPQDALLSAIGETVGQVERRYLQAASQDINKMTASALANQASQRLLENDDFKTRQLQIIISNDDKRNAFQPHLRTSVTHLSGGTANTGPDRIAYLSNHADKRLQAIGDAAGANPNLARTF